MTWGLQSEFDQIDFQVMGKKTAGSLHIWDSKCIR